MQKITAINSKALADCANALRSGEIICYPTETFYALGVDYFNSIATDRLYALKGRPAEKEFPCIAADRDQVAQFCVTSHPAFARLVSRFWPGPLTLVLPAKHKEGKTIAVRVSSHPVARELASRLGTLIVSTSANRSGEEPVMNPHQLPFDIEAGISILVDGGQSNGGMPSTIVSLVGDEVLILRKGAIPTEEINRLL